MGINAAREDPNMASFPRPEVPNNYTTIRSLKWSSAEKVIARRA
jgi:hypothetical protein